MFWSCFGVKVILFLVFAREHWQVWGQVWLWLFGSASGTSSHETPTRRCRCPAAGPTRLLLFRLHSAMSLKGIESHRQHSVLCSWSLRKLIGPLCSLADRLACRDFTCCPTCGTAGSAALQLSWRAWLSAFSLVDYITHDDMLFLIYNFQIYSVFKMLKYVLGPMKEEAVTPGTTYPLLGKLLCFLPEHLKKKLCCVTPLGQTVRNTETGDHWLLLSIDLSDIPDS